MGANGVLKSRLKVVNNHPAAVSELFLVDFEKVRRVVLLDGGKTIIEIGAF